MHYGFFIHNGIAGWWLSKQTNFDMNFVFSKGGWCQLSFYDPKYCHGIHFSMIV
jgi:hypothetical protein